MTSNTNMYQSASSNESFKSSTYFGSTNTTDNYTNTSNEREINDCNASRRRDEASTSKGIAQIATKRKSLHDSNIPTKIAVFYNEDSAYASSMNCIASRTRRKSVDKNKVKEIYAQSVHTSSITTNVTPTTSNVVPTSIGTVSIIDSSPESNCSDIISVDTPSSHESTTATIGTPTTSTRHLLTQQSFIGTISSNSNNGEKLRARLLRRSFSIYDEHDYAKPIFAHSSTSGMAHWSNLKGNADAYIMPRYVRINGKLKRVSTETVLQQQQQANTTPESQWHFARSYNLLLHTLNDGHHANSSRTKSSV